MRLIQLISKNLANFLKAFLTKLFSCIFAIKISKTIHYFIDQKTFEIFYKNPFSVIITHIVPLQMSHCKKKIMIMLKHKFKAKPVTDDGIRFTSKKEHKRYTELKTLQKYGEVLFFLRQVPFHLPGGVKYLCDYLVFWVSGVVTIEDVKGMKTPMYILKKKQVEATYPITINEI